METSFRCGRNNWTTMVSPKVAFICLGKLGVTPLAALSLSEHICLGKDENPLCRLRNEIKNSGKENKEAFRMFSLISLMNIA